MSTPDDQSIQRLPHLSDTVKLSALCQTTGGCPAIDRGSDRLSSSKIGREAGTGSGVRIVRKRVLILGTATGVRSYSAMCSGRGDVWMIAVHDLHGRTMSRNRQTRRLRHQFVAGTVRRRGKHTG